MKSFLFLLLAAVAADGHAQNWNPLGRVGVKRYFTNTDGYLRGMRVDSIRAVGADSVWYPFRTIRGPVPSQTLDSNGSSWLGKAVRKKPDGTWLFNTWKSDTVVVRSLAAVGESWRFYDDTGALWYRATLSSVGVQTVLGVSDSVKTISLTAMSGASPLPSDSVNGWTVVLSKHHGFVAVPDLYMLPYPKDGTQNAQQDLFFGIITSDQAMFGSSAWGSYAGVSKARFSIIGYEHPAPAELYATWQPGDALYYTWSRYSTSYTDIGRFVDTVTARTTGSTGDILTLNRWKWNTITGSVSHTNQSVSADSTPLVDTARMPEEYKNPRTCYYNPTDTNYSITSALWHFYTGFFSPTGSSIWPFIGQNVYKASVGHVYYYNPCGQYPCDETRMAAYRIGGVAFGYPFGPPLSISEAHAGLSAVSVSPVPATTRLRIPHPAGALTFLLADATGRMLIVAQSNSVTSTTEIDVSMLAEGVYALLVTAPDGSRHAQKIVIDR